MATFARIDPDGAIFRCSAATTWLSWAIRWGMLISPCQAGTHMPGRKNRQA